VIDSDTSRRIVVRPPSPRLADGEISYVDRQPVDVALAEQQWAHYVDAFRTAGWDVIEVPALDDHPDGVFIEDNVVVHRELAIVCRPGAESRRGEIDAIGDRFSELGYSVASIEAPGHLDGGDVLKVGGTVYVGRSARSDAAGIEQFRRLLEAEGATVVEVPVTAALHLKSCLTALPDGTIVGYAPLVDEPDAFARLYLAPEESGAHVVDLGDGRILVASSCPTSAEHYRSLGYDVVAVDISEFEKLEGCVTCLSIRLHDGVD
jgi:dimethylargininase